VPCVLPTAPPPTTRCTPSDDDAPFDAAASDAYGTRSLANPPTPLPECSRNGRSNKAHYESAVMYMIHAMILTS